MELQKKIDLIHQMIKEMQRKNTEMMNQIKKESEQINMISQKFEQIVNVVNTKKEKEKEKEKVYTSLKDENKNYLIKMTMILLESYANKFGKGDQRTNIYSEHNYKDTANELKSQLISQLEILRISHTLYSKEYGKYDFQSNLSQSYMIHMINMWKTMVPPEDKKYYEAAINIIQGKPSKSFANELEKLGSISPSFLPRKAGFFYKKLKVGQDDLYHHDYQQTEQAPQINPYFQDINNPNTHRTGAQERQRRNEREQLDNLFDNVEKTIAKMGQQRNVSPYLNEYNSYSKQFIQFYNQFIQKYQHYWYKDDKNKDKLKVQTIKTMCNGFGQHCSMFNELFICLAPYPQLK